VSIIFPQTVKTGTKDARIAYFFSGKSPRPLVSSVADC